MSRLVCKHCNNKFELINSLISRAKHERENNNEETDNPEAEKVKKSKKVFDMIQEMIEKEGPKGFYKGVLPYFIGTLASFGVYFFWYSWWFKVISNSRIGMNSSRPFSSRTNSVFLDILPLLYVPDGLPHPWQILSGLSTPEFSWIKKRIMASLALLRILLRRKVSKDFSKVLVLATFWSWTPLFNSSSMSSLKRSLKVEYYFWWLEYNSF